MTWLSLVTQEREFQQDSNSISLVCIHCRIFNMLETFHSKRIEYSALHRNENGIFENFISSMLLELLATQSIARHGCNMKNIDPKPSQRILLISNSVNLFFSPLSLSRSAIDNVSRSNYVCSLSIEDVFMCMESWSFWSKPAVCRAEREKSDKNIRHRITHTSQMEKYELNLLNLFRRDFHRPV